MKREGETGKFLSSAGEKEKRLKKKKRGRQQATGKPSVLGHRGFAVEEGRGKKKEEHKKGSLVGALGEGEGGNGSREEKGTTLPKKKRKGSLNFRGSQLAKRKKDRTEKEGRWEVLREILEGKKGNDPGFLLGV